MSEKLSANTFKLSSASIISFGAIVGKKENEGPLGSFFDKFDNDTTFGEKTWEKAERKLQQNNINLILSKCGMTPKNIDVIFSGDLLNQCISSSFSIRDFDIPFYGIYGACSTMAQGLGLASIFVDNNLVENAMAIASSHFCAAEKQFRFPLEYGGQRTTTAQWTVTGSGGVIVAKNNTPPYVKGVTIGSIRDFGITDVNNMGAAMAPAAAYTINKYLKDTNTNPSDYDLILTGDLGYIGSSLLIDLLKLEKVDIHKNHNDCGKMIFDQKTQDTHAGGSGCGCSASVLCGYILNQIKQGILKNVLFIATGALMSTTSVQQGESIPGIAHLVHISHTN